MIPAALLQTRMVDGKLIAFEPDGVTPLRHVPWTTIGGLGPGIRLSDMPADGEPMEWMRDCAWAPAP